MRTGKEKKRKGKKAKVYCMSNKSCPNYILISLYTKGLRVLGHSVERMDHCLQLKCIAFRRMLED